MFGFGEGLFLLFLVFGCGFWSVFENFLVFGFVFLFGCFFSGCYYVDEE